MSLTSILSNNPLTKKSTGALHKALGISTSKKIPADKLVAALKSKNPKIRKMAQLAKTFAKYRKG